MGKKKGRRNVYKHSIDLKGLKIRNVPREEFRKNLEAIPYRGYEVEQLHDGRTVVIAKPGGKTVYGRPKKEDFLVWVYDPAGQELWQITHKQILEDLEAKAVADPSIALYAIECLERVCEGEEPNDVVDMSRATCGVGESIELLTKVYKWIWGQEDVNYPTGEGRYMSMKDIIELKERLSRSSG